MKNEQIEEIINYLNNNKNNLLPSFIDTLKLLSNQIIYEKSKKELLELDNVFLIESLDDNMLDFILNNPELLMNKKISNEEFNRLAIVNKLKSTSNILDSSLPIDLSILYNEQHSKDKGSNYPSNIPPLLSKEEIQKKLMTFPLKKSEEARQNEEIQSLNAKIKSYQQEHIAKIFEPSKPIKNLNNSIDLIDSFQWIEESEVQKLQEELATFGTPDKIAKVKKYLEKIQNNKSILQFNKFEDFQSLIKNCPNFKEVSQFYKGSFVLNNSKFVADKSYNAPTPILLLGEPGIGKTHFAKKLAKLLGTTFHFLDSNSITASWVLTGSSGQWQNADAGNIFKYILESNTVSPVVILDEIDKLSQGKNYDPFSVFHQMFEPENSAQFKDEFLNITFDASKIIYILTANNINNIPESLLSRMRVFDIKRPSEEEMIYITQNIYKEIIGNTPLLKSELLESTLNKLVSLPPRDIKKHISNAVFSQLAENQELDQELILKFDETQKNWGF